jgi:2,3-bisphosphoglycerate-dependent phosphoglycerate mutase
MPSGKELDPSKTPEHVVYWQRAYAAPADSAEIFFVRHGASAPVVAGEEHDFTPDGWGDPSLAPEGLRQAAALADRLDAVPAVALFATPLRRTSETARPLAESTGLTPRVVPELAEVHMGQWEGAQHRIRIALDDHVWRRALREERWDVIPGAESMENFATRVRAGVEKIATETGPGNCGVAFVHGGVIGEICRQASGSRPFAFVYSDNASITRVICHADGSWQMRGFNDVAHLAGLR